VSDDVCSRCAVPVALIACSKSKNHLPLGGKPEELYSGKLLHRQLTHARRVLQLPDAHIFILSAKYGLVALCQQVAPYELALASLPAKERDMWGFRVVNELVHTVPGVVQVYLMAGEVYRTAVIPYLDEWDVEYIVPHPAEMGIGKQMAWYKQQEVEG